ncbi:GNAT family N-acetyltransferase [Sphingobacterium sp. BIGb0165]|uniref:GNAT family N-acetyltransferase n=1 Tax=Sphingobacterium sp. BIGb0165 TaxID=2940615 RepID=UPI002168F577|nr:GNAT family N-acetyltransferase [Sphingobacterium sp. BIGb0165]MCS4224093.1 hypothetical protein [Sphingobacterium sp. BIGb0165]
MNLQTKFTIASEEGLKLLFLLKKEQIHRMYDNQVDSKDLKNYLDIQLSNQRAADELNNLSTQLISIFVDAEPVGYAMMKQSPVPELLKGVKVIHYADFYIRDQYDNQAIRECLWKKCQSVTNFYNACWIELLQTDPLVPFFEDCGFRIEQQSLMEPFGKKSYIMIWKRN